MKKSILFVDDESQILQSLRRALHAMRDQWEMFFAESGKEALEIMQAQDTIGTPIDVLVSDVRMPEMNGAELLQRVMDQFPQTIRFILSGHSDQEMVLQTTHTAHQFLNKPCELSVLKSAIQRALQLRELLSSDALRTLAPRFHTIPSLPVLYQQLMEEVQKRDWNPDKLGAIISQDLAMTAKILQLVNSAFFSLPRKITSAKEAVVFLGINIVKALILTANVFEKSKGSGEQVAMMNSLWEHSLNIANLSRAIAGFLKEPPRVQEDCYVAGMLHDLGKVMMIQLPEYFPAVPNLSKTRGIRWWVVEKELFNTTHAEVGAYLLGLWGLSETLVETLAFHHQPGQSLVHNFTPLAAVYLANQFSHATDPDLNGVENQLDMNFLRNVGLDKRLPEIKEVCRKLLGKEEKNL